MLCSIIDLMTMNRLLSSPPHDNSSFLQYISALDKNNYDRGFLGRYQRLEGISLPFQFHTEYLNQPAGGNGCLRSRGCTATSAARRPPLKNQASSILSFHLPSNASVEKPISISTAWRHQVGTCCSPRFGGQPGQYPSCVYRPLTIVTDS